MSSASSVQREYLSVRQFAEIYGISIPYVHKMIREDRLPVLYTKVGSIYRIDYASFLRFRETGVPERRSEAGPLRPGKRGPKRRAPLPLDPSVFNPAAVTA